MVEENEIRVLVNRKAEERLLRRIRVWSSLSCKPNLIFAGIGKLEDLVEADGRATIARIEDFIEIPFQINYARRQLEIYAEQLRKLAKTELPISIIHFDAGNIEFSELDRAISLFEDLILGRPIFHFKIDSKGCRKLLNFIGCWNCLHSPLFTKKRGQEVKTRWE